MDNSAVDDDSTSDPDRYTVSATLSKTGLPNHPPLLFELVFDEGRRIATAASIPDESLGFSSTVSLPSPASLEAGWE